MHVHIHTIIYTERHIHTYMCVYVYIVYTCKHAYTHTYTCFRNKEFTLVSPNSTPPTRFSIGFSGSVFVFPFFHHENPGCQQHQHIYSCAE